MRQQTILKHSAIQKEKHPISVPTMAPYSGAFLLFAGVLVFLKGYETLCIYLRVCNLSAAKHFSWKSCFLDTCIAVDLRKRSCMTNCTKDNNKIVQYPLPAVPFYGEEVKDCNATGTGAIVVLRKHSSAQRYTLLRVYIQQGS